MFLKLPAGIKRFKHLFLIGPEISAVLQLKNCVFRCSWNVHVLRSKSRTRSEIPFPNPLLPLSNYRLPADKLQVCCVCLCLLGYNRWSKACVCLAGYASQIHITLVEQKHLESEWGSTFLHVLPREFQEKEDLFFASPRSCNLVHTGLVQQKKLKCSPLWNPAGKVCHSKLGEDDLFRGVQMIW